MKSILVALCLLMVSAEAHAISRYNSTSMSCADVWAKIAAEGAVIMRWRSKRNPSLPLYGRFVADDFFCDAAERGEWSFIPTKDRNSCRVLECKPYYRDDDEWLWFRR